MVMQQRYLEGLEHRIVDINSLVRLMLPFSTEPCSAIRCDKVRPSRRRVRWRPGNTEPGRTTNLKLGRNGTWRGVFGVRRRARGGRCGRSAVEQCGSAARCWGGRILARNRGQR